MNCGPLHHCSWCLGWIQNHIWWCGGGYTGGKSAAKCSDTPRGATKRRSLPLGTHVKKSLCLDLIYGRIWNAFSPIGWFRLIINLMNNESIIKRASGIRTESDHERNTQTTQHVVDFLRLSVGFNKLRNQTSHKPMTAMMGEICLVLLLLSFINKPWWIYFPNFILLGMPHSCDMRQQQQGKQDYVLMPQLKKLYHKTWTPHPAFCQFINKS